MKYVQYLVALSIALIGLTTAPVMAGALDIAASVRAT